LVENNDSITGIVLNNDKTISTVTYDEDEEKGIYINSDESFLLTLNFKNMTWSIEEIE